MGAKKGIKRKVLEWLEANPGVRLTGRELERMYVEHGGSVYPDDCNHKSRRGRVDQVTMENFIGGLPLKRVSTGPQSLSNFKQYIERATFEHTP